MDRIRADLIKARKSRDKLRTLVLSTTLSDLKNAQIEKGGPLEDAEVTRVVAKAAKQRREAAGQMREAGRDELADREEAEAAILEAYLPESLDPERVRALIRRAVAEGAEDIGAVMRVLMPEIRGRFDGAEANRMVREELAG